MQDDTRALLTELDDALDEMGPLVPLSDERFLETHVLYEGRSDQQHRIISWFAEQFASAVPADAPYRVLSVGCGSGILDVPVAEALAAPDHTLRYVGVDPNAVECQTFEQRFAAAELPGDASLTVDASPFEQFEDPEGFDLVHLVHCLYYVPDARRALEKAHALLRPGGKVVLVHAPCAALNELAVRFYDKGYGRPTLFSDDCASLMTDLGWTYARSRIDAEVDVTPMHGGDPGVALALRDFIVQFDTLKLPPEVQSLVDRYLALVSQPRSEGTVIIDHPADVFVIAES